MTYKLYIANNGTTPNAAMKTENGITVSFLFDPANTDYQNFKKEVLAGAELQDADGNLMTQAQADEFIASLP